MASIDLNDTYFTVPISQETSSFLLARENVSVLSPTFWFISSTKNFPQNNEIPNGSFKTDGA